MPPTRNIVTFAVTMLVWLTTAVHLCLVVTTVDNPVKYVHSERIKVNQDNYVRAETAEQIDRFLRLTAGVQPRVRLKNHNHIKMRTEVMIRSNVMASEKSKRNQGGEQI